MSRVIAALAVPLLVATCLMLVFWFRLLALWWRAVVEVAHARGREYRAQPDPHAYGSSV